MNHKEQRIGAVQLLLDICPHCGVASPILHRVWASEGPTLRNDGLEQSSWAAYLCTTCGSLISARGQAGRGVINPKVEKLFPDVKVFEQVIPERVRSFLSQAYRTRGAPDASVVMSASAIDAMLKHFSLKDGSLYTRIDEAVSGGLLAKSMGDWAHQVRLDANKPRHADESNSNMSLSDAERAYDFAETIAELLFVLPSRMPNNPS